MTDKVRHSMPVGRVPGVKPPLSRLVMGSVHFDGVPRSFAHGLLDAYMELGGNVVDTARHYGDSAESAIGTWMQARRNRSQMVVIGKGAHPDPAGSRVCPGAIRSDLERSLELLQTDYIDLYLLHRDDPSIPAGEIVGWLNELLTAGLVRAIGGSNWTTQRLDQANRFAVQHGLMPLVASSPNMSLAVPNEPPWPGCLSLTSDDREWYLRQQLAVIAWSAQAQGFFSGRYREDDRSNPDMVRTWYSSDNFERLRRVRQLAERQGCSPIAVALAWVIRQPFPVFAVVGPRSIEELQSSGQAVSVHLTAADVRWLDLEGENAGSSTA